MRNFRHKVSFVILVALAACWSTSCVGQWKFLASFGNFDGNYIETIFFLPGPPTVGFVGGADGTVFRTSDGGKHWTQTSTPNSFYPVSAFTFKDSLTGWFSILGYDSVHFSTCYKTTDGGVTWFQLDETSERSSVYYNKVSKRLFLVAWDAFTSYSDDEGATWNDLPFIWQNGLAFLSDSVGILDSKNQYQFARTTDGGMSWLPSPLVSETWQAFASPCSGSFLALGEKDGDLFRSDDSAKSWYPVDTNFNTYPPQSAGDLQGDNNYLVTQTADGVYVSTDQGQTWNPTGASPSATTLDLRFYYVNGIVYAGDPFGNLFVDTLPLRVSPGRLIINSPSKIALQSSACIAVDSTIRLTGPEFCEASTILSISALDSSDIKLKTSVPLPQNAEPPITLQFHYKPGAKDSSGTRVDVHYSILNQIYDTIIYVSGIKSIAGAMAIDTPFIQFVLPTACNDKDTLIKFRNLSCDTIWITHDSLGDSGYFQLLNPIKASNPIAIPPDSIAKIEIQTHGIVAGSFQTSLKVTYGNRVRSADTVLQLALQVASAQKPVMNKLSIVYPNLCSPFDSSFTIVNHGCDTLEILGDTILGARDFYIPAGMLPIKVAPGDSVHLVIQGAAAGIEQVNGELQLEMSLHGTNYDTLLAVTFIVNAGLPVIQSSPANPNAGSVNICSSRSFPIYIQYPLCNLITLDSVTLIGDTTDFHLVLQPPNGTKPAAGQADSVMVLFAPVNAGASGAGVRFSYTINGIPFDTTIAVVGTGLPAVSAYVGIGSFGFDTVLPCASKTLSTWFKNTGCDSISVISFGGASSQNILVLGPLVGTEIPPGDSTQVTIEMDSKLAGQVLDSLLLTYLGSDGTLDSIQLNVTGFIWQNVPLLGLNSPSLKLDSISPCAIFDTTIVLKNLNLCDTLQIDSISFTGSQMISLGALPALPVTLKSLDSIPITFGFAPGDHQVFVGSLHVVGIGIDTTIAIQGSSKSSGTRSLTISSISSHDTVAGCSTTVDSVRIQNTSCGDLIIDSASIVGIQMPNSRYSFLSLPNLPDTLPSQSSLTLKVVLDASASGDTNCLLTIGSIESGILKQDVLAGSILPISSEHVDMVPASGGMLLRDTAGTTVSAILELREAVPAAEDLKTINLGITFTNDLLIPKSITAEPGWSLADSNSNAGRIALEFTRTGVGALPAASPVAEFTYRLSLSKTLASELIVDSLSFNSTDPNFATCVLQTIPPIALPVELIPICGDSILSSALGGTPIISGVTVHPNPAGGSGMESANIEFTLGSKAVVSVDILDAIGQTTLRPQEYSLDEGAATLAIPVSGLSEGLYFVRVRAQGQTEVVKLAVQR